MDQYGEAHRTFLTYIRTVKSKPVDVLEQRFQMLAEHFEITLTDPPKDLRDFIAAINVELEGFGFKIDSIRDQESGVLHYIYVNTRLDEQIQGCTPYSAPELDAIKQLIDNIINASDFAFSVPYVNSKQQIAAVLRSKASAAEFFLRRIHDDGWFETRQGRLVLSTTAMADLREYLRDRFGVFCDQDTLGTLLQCHVCKEIVTLGCKCPTSDCPLAYHNKCFRLYSRDKDTCPNENCHAALSEMHSVGVQS